MKKISSLLTMCLASVFLYSQDIIVTMDAQKIEAKILEVSKTEIRYKEADNLEGPTFILQIEDINSIIYSNGKVVLYNQNASNSSKTQTTIAALNSQTKKPVVPQQTPNDSVDIYLHNGEIIHAQLVGMNSEGADYIIGESAWHIPAQDIQKIVFASGQVKTYNYTKQTIINASNTIETQSSEKQHSTENLTGRIYRDNGHYLYNDTYISSKEVERILQRENGIAYEQWRKAEGLLIGAGVCTGIGAGLAVGGIFPMIWGNYGSAIAFECTALIPLGVGLGLALGSSSRHNKAIDIYNSKYDNAAIQLNFFTSPTEVGIALSF